MFKLALFELIFACAALAAQIPKQEQPTLDGRIIGGTETNIVNYPHQVSLQKDGYHECGGAILSNKVIITAAHCLWLRENPSRFSIRAGSSYHDEGGIIERVKSYRIHDKYDVTKEDSPYDIALIYLERSLPKNNNIRQIDLVKKAPADGASAYVTGWGVTNAENLVLSEKLRRVEVNIISSKRCASSNFTYGVRIKDSMICAAAPARDACQGDSGGPLTVDGFLAGMVSWGEDCAAAKAPGVYTNVYFLRDWILKYAQ